MPQTATKRFTFSAHFRLKKRADFLRVQSKGRKIHGHNFLVLIGEPLTEHPRLGVTVTTKVDKRAAVRNRIKRRLREIFRLNRHKFSRTFDMVIVARQNAPACSYQETEREILGALVRGGLLKSGDQ